MRKKGLKNEPSRCRARQNRKNARAAPVRCMTRFARSAERPLRCLSSLKKIVRFIVTSAIKAVCAVNVQIKITC